jgi:hypothetical protein
MGKLGVNAIRFSTDRWLLPHNSVYLDPGSARNDDFISHARSVVPFF